MSALKGAGFFAAVTRLQRRARREPMGFDGPARKEPLRIRPASAMGFPAGEIDEIGNEENGPLSMSVNFFGLYGPSGVLPSHYTELLVNEGRSYDRDPPVKAFLDIFNHRLISLFYRAWSKYRFHTRPDSVSMRSCLGSFLGLGESLPPGPPLRAYAGLLSRRIRSASALKGMVRDILKIRSVKITPLIGSWVPVPGDQQCGLNRGQRLGRDTHLGKRVFNRTGKFRIEVGPLDYGEARTLLPGEKRFEMLAEAVRIFAGALLDFDVKVCLHGGDVPPSRLESRSSSGPRLGRDAWILSGGSSGPLEAVYLVSVREGE